MLSPTRGSLAADTYPGHHRRYPVRRKVADRTEQAKAPEPQGPTWPAIAYYLADGTDRMLFEGALHDARRLKLRLLNSERFNRYQKQRTAPESGRGGYGCFDSTRSIFVHIPKTGGISVAMALYGHYAGSHTPLRDYQMVFSASDFRRYFKFTFVRNPWDRLYSAYRFLSTGGIDRYDRAWADANLRDVPDFESFVLKVLPRPDIQTEVHLKPQVDFLRNSVTRAVGVDFVGRYERLEQDFAIVAKRLGHDTALPHFNRSQVQGTYRDAYSTPMKVVIEEMYAADIKTFGYGF